MPQGRGRGRGRGQGPPLPPPGPPGAFPVLPRDPKRLADLALHPNFLTKIDVFNEPPTWGGTGTPDFITPDPLETLADGVTPKFLLVDRETREASRAMPDGQVVPFFGFSDPNDLHPDGTRYNFPSDIIRVTEGQIFHGNLTGLRKGGFHTIHWHGIEPSSHNDGVGKLSMEVGDPGYIYQWFASHAGTYFYHCHKNTVLHFEWGMYGMLLIDPLAPGGAADPHAVPQALSVADGGPPFTSGYGYPTGGPGWVRYMDGYRPYHVEAIWVSDDVYSDWHLLGPNEGLATSPAETPLDVQGNPIGFNPTAGKGLNIWRPDYFVISGVPHPWSKGGAFLPTPNPPLAGDPITVPDISATVQVGQTLLIRLLSASYGLDRYTVLAEPGVAGLNLEVIAMDGKTMGRAPFEQYNQPFFLPAGAPFFLTAARRFDILVTPTAAAQIGTHTFRVEFLDHVTGVANGFAETLIHVVE